MCSKLDIVQESKDKKEAVEKLENLEKKLRDAYSLDKLIDTEDKSYPDELPWWYAFEDTIKRFEIPIESFLQQIEGQYMDIDFIDIPSTEALIKYCRLVAGSVGIMMLPLLAAEGYDKTNPDFIIACENLGVGMQITNILRDVGEDLRTRNRIYIPADLLKYHGITRSELENLAQYKKEKAIEFIIPENFILIWEKLSQLADDYYKDYEAWLSWFHPSCRLPLVAAALSYHAIADSVRKEAYNCFTKRCYTSPLTRALLIKEALTRIQSIT
jgi:phytoene synthase